MEGDNRRVFYLSTAAFLACTVAAGTGLFESLDATLFGLAQEYESRAVDLVGLVASVAGGVEFVAVAALALALGLVLRGRGRLAWRLLAAFVATGLVEVLCKMVVPQPPVPGDALRGPDPSLFDVSTPYPYPSGHMLRAVLLFGAIYVLWPNRLARIGIVVFLIVSAVSRLYLGTHWPSDMLGGALLGIAGLAWAFGSFQPSAISRQEKSAKRR